MSLKVLEVTNEELLVELPSLEATAELAAVCAKVLQGGVAIGLSGGLGAGKTEFVRQLVGALRGLPAAACRDVVSPSFMLEAVYPLCEGRPVVAVHHWDLYRVAGGELPGELDEIIADTRLLKLIEWHERVPSLARLLSLELVIAFSGLLPSKNGVEPYSADSQLDGPVLFGAGLAGAGEEPMPEGRTCRIRIGAGMRSKASGTDLWSEIRAVLLKKGP